MGERADGAGKLADRDRLAGTPHAGDVPCQLCMPERQLQAECHRLGVHAVRSPDHGRLSMFVGASTNRAHEAVEARQDQVAGFAHLQRLRGVDDVGGGQAEVKPPRGGTDMFGHGGGKGDDIVLGDLLDLFDARDVEPAAFPNVARGLGGHDTGACHRFGGGRLDLEPGLVPSADRSTSDPSPGWYTVQSSTRQLSERQPLWWQLEAIDRTKHGSGEPAIGEQILRHTPHVVLGDPLDTFQRLVQSELAIEIDLLAGQM